MNFALNCSSIGDFNPWNTTAKDFQPCFLYLGLEIPIFVILAITSAYKAGTGRSTFSNHPGWNSYQSAIIYCRAVIVGFLAIIPGIVLLTREFGSLGDTVSVEDGCLVGVKTLGWLLHLVFLVKLKPDTFFNTRGPTSVLLSWVLTAIVSLLALRSQYIVSNYLSCIISEKNKVGPSDTDYFLIDPFVKPSDNSMFLVKMLMWTAFVECLLQGLYLITLYPSDGLPEEHSGQGQQSTRDRAGIFSKLFFWWVTPILKVGARGLLKTSKELYDLPQSLNTQEIAKKFHACARKRQPLLQTLSNCYGREIFSIGFIKLGSDLLKFGGPLLLVRLINFVEEEVEIDSCNNSNTDKTVPGYLIVGGLFCANFLGTLCDIHCKMRMAELSLKIKSSLLTEIYNKIFTLRTSDIQNLLNANLGNRKPQNGPAINLHVRRKHLVQRTSVTGSDFHNDCRESSPLIPADIQTGHGHSSESSPLIPPDFQTNFRESSPLIIADIQIVDSSESSPLIRPDYQIDQSTATAVQTNFTDEIMKRVTSVVSCCQGFHKLWSKPFQIVVSLHLLYWQIGVSFLPGLLFVVLMIPANWIMVKSIGAAGAKMMKFKQNRVNLISKALTGNIDDNGSVQDVAMKVKDIREQELKCLKVQKYVEALSTYFCTTTPVLLSIFCFTTYVSLGNQLTAANVFASISLFNILAHPLHTFSGVLIAAVEAWNSVKILGNLINADEMDPKFYDDIPLDSRSTHRLITEHSNFRSSTSEIVLQDINISLQMNQVIGVVGEAGSGKSNLLLALMGEMEKTKGVIRFQKKDLYDFGFVPQEPWIKQGSIRDNILFGQPFDEQNYKNVLKACCLKDDAKEMNNDDRIEERKHPLSVSQKIRISIARAVYKKKSIYLLDDIFSAFENQLTKDLVRKCVYGLMKDTTRIICTNQLNFLRDVDWILQMHEGKIIKQGRPQDILTTLPEIESPVSKPPITIEAEPPVNNTVRGSVGIGIYIKYLKFVGYFSSIGILLLQLIMQISKNASDIWITNWVNATNSSYSHPAPELRSTISLPQHFIQLHQYHQHLHEESIRSSSSLDPSVKYYFTIFVIIGVLNSLMSFVRSFSFVSGCIHAGKRIHDLLIDAIWKAKAEPRFSDKTSIQKVLDKLSSAQQMVDDSLPRILDILLTQLAGFLGILIVICYAHPWILLLILPMLAIIFCIQKYYNRTSRQLTQLSSASLSAFHAHFSDTFNGLITIRAMGDICRFQSENEQLIDESQKSEFSTQAISQWLTLQLQFIGALTIAGVSFIGVLQHESQMANAAMLGLAVSYSFTVGNSLSSAITSITETEKEMVAVQKIDECIHSIADGDGGNGAGEDPLVPLTRPPSPLPYSWVKREQGEAPEGSLVGGREYYDVKNKVHMDVYVARADYEGETIPGKLISEHKVTYVPYWDRKEKSCDKYEALVVSAEFVDWVPYKEGEVPPLNAIEAGKALDGHILYVGRVEHQYPPETKENNGAEKYTVTTVGSFDPNTSTLSIPYNGEVISFNKFQVLVLK